MKRIFLTVLDSLGVGEMFDSEKFGDVGANTLASASKYEGFSIPNMISLGLYNIDGVDFPRKADRVCAAYGRAAERSCGKDTTVGHWEIAGVISEKPFPTYPDGFPDEILSRFSKAVGRGVLCNKPYSGTDVIRDFGAEHIMSGDLIVYTSADSVFQIAAHEDIVPVHTLYEYCEIAREILQGEHGVGRVIARPFVGEVGDFRRTQNRCDFSLPPPSETMLDAISSSGRDVIAVGKISDIFCGRGITEKIVTHGNTDGIRATKELLRRDFSGLCFINLVDFDMIYGHRNDIDGYGRALMEYDSAIPEFLKLLRDDDLFIITADHGCDPGDVSTDHTREYVPILVCGRDVVPKNLGTMESFSDIAATVCDILGVDFVCPGKSFKDDLF